MKIAAIYEYEIRRKFSIEDLVKGIIFQQTELKIHLFSPPERGLCKVLPELSQATGYLRNQTHKQK
jgi:hypothetical protein